MLGFLQHVLYLQLVAPSSEIWQTVERNRTKTLQQRCQIHRSDLIFLREEKPRQAALRGQILRQG